MIQSSRLAILLPALGCALMLSGGSPSAGEIDPVEREVQTARERLFQAMIHQDQAAAGALISDRLTYVHGTGTINNRAQFLAGLMGNDVRYREIMVHKSAYTPLADGGLLVAQVEFTSDIKGQFVDGQFRRSDHFIHQSNSYILSTLWEKRKGHWTMVLWQATRLINQI